MSTNKNINRICCVVLIITMAVAVLFMNSESFGVEAESNLTDYEDRLFDTSRVHTINIEIDDWDAFLETASSEEYTACNLEIDGETFYNVAIRGKGNTSLSSVEAYGNNRYSFKVEFDHYDDSTTYYGLDKLALNNIIQDNTYMKDYLIYTMMSAFDVDAPLVSYTQILVNGEEWGLYLAVESVEDGFMKRTYGSNTSGELYKPDSMSMGEKDGGEMPEFDSEKMEEMMQQMQEKQNESGEENSSDATESADGNMPQMQGPPGEMGGDFPGGMGSNDVALVYTDDDAESYSNIFDNAKTDLTTADKNRLIESLKKLNNNEDIEEIVNVEEVLRYFIVHNFSTNFDSYTGSMMHNYYLYEEDGQLSMIPWDYNLSFGAFSNGGGDEGGGPGGMPGNADEMDKTSTVPGETDDTSIQPDMSEQAINNAGMTPPDFAGMTPPDNAGRIAPSEEGKTAPENEGMTAPDAEGGMPMGGGMGAENAKEMINYPIDSPLSGAEIDERPMIAWIFNNEEYTEQYHELFQEFLNQFFANDEIITEIERVRDMIAPYVESDPTKFCTYEEFETGVEALLEFISLRAESIQGQLDGIIPSTSEGQEADDSTLIDSGDLNLNDMGSMGAGGGGFGDKGGPGEKNSSDTASPTAEDANTEAAANADASSSEGADARASDAPEDTNTAGGGMMPEGPGHVDGSNSSQSTLTTENLILLGITGLALLLGIGIAVGYRRRG